VIPDEAVEAAGDVLVYHQRRDIKGCACGWSELGRSHAAHQARIALEAAAPHLLSHEREETRLAHVDAVVNAETVDKLQAKLDRVERALDHAEANGNYKLYSTDIRAAITDQR